MALQDENNLKQYIPLLYYMLVELQGIPGCKPYFQRLKKSDQQAVGSIPFKSFGKGAR